MNFGDPRLPGRFWSKCIPEPNSGCWLWTAYLDRDGYGTIRIGLAKFRAHRVAYDAKKQTIPPGLQIDHLCRTPCCVNPEHLEAVTPGENTRRGLTGHTSGSLLAVRSRLSSRT
jgi:hypothetical protein